MRIFLVLSLPIIVLACNVASGAEPQEEKKIVLIGHKLDHPWATHMYLPTCELLAKCLRQTDGIEVVVSDGWPKDESVMKGVDCIVMYCSPGAEILLDGPHAGEVDRLMKEGVGLVAIHWATGCHQKNVERIGDQFVSYLGGMWVHFTGLKITESSLVQLASDHPINRGWKEFPLKEEYYYAPVISEAAQQQWRALVNDKNLTVAWTYERPGGGRSFGTTLGHFFDSFKNESFRRAIVNGILWSSQVEIPEEGASVKLTDEDLKLPPKPNDSAAALLRCEHDRLGCLLASRELSPTLR